MEELTWGEAVETVLARREGERRRNQQRSVIAWVQAQLTGLAMAGEQLPEVWEAFPFWNEEEIKEMKLEKYRRIMERYAAAGKGGSSHG